MALLGHGEAKRDKNYTVIIGCGRVGARLATSLSEAGKDVLVIDADSNAFRALGSNFAGLTMAGDAQDYAVLRKANIAKAYAVIVLTHDDNANIMIAQIAHEIFRVEHVIARLYNPDRQAIYEQLHIHVISPEQLMTERITSTLTTLEQQKVSS